ncbi:putative baseplate assembly protein [Alteromonadaceae bacterium Bs31]|nr:putative baseplate assembly protein [Alteromonadaceae bacterium Bs31]
MPNLFPAPPAIDDRRFDDLVAELLARVPAHTPEWKPQEGDPGRTLIELFAWLADTILYRANLIPEKQRLAFLELLGKPLSPARAARGLVRLQPVNPVTIAQLVTRESLIAGPVNFETTEDINLLPVTGDCYYKRELSETEQSELADVLSELKDFHELDDIAGYVTERAFDPDLHLPSPLNVAEQVVDKCLWLVLLAPTPADVEAVKASLAGADSGQAQQLMLGFDPGYQIAEALDDIELGGEVDFSIAISTGELDEQGQPVYLPLDISDDPQNPNSTAGLTRRGMMKLTLPASTSSIGVVGGDVRSDANAGVGARPPRLDDPEKIARAVAWLRVQFDSSLSNLPIGYLGINTVTVEQRISIRNQVVAQSNGSADQLVQLPWKNLQKQSLELQVDETGRGYVSWQRVDDLALYGRDDSVYVLNPGLATLQFGNGVFGRIPEAGRRIRIASAWAGGGSEGNLKKGSLTSISARGLDGNLLGQPLTLTQVVATEGGSDAETLAEAERRLPAWLKHRNRAVVEDDYRHLALETPGVDIGRVEVLPRFLPLQRSDNKPGVVSVMVLPQKERLSPPNARADKPLVTRVYQQLKARTPIAAELYVISCEYLPIALSIAISLRQGFSRDQVIYDVKQAFKEYLWSLPPHGPFGEGWPLGRKVGDREMEVVAARVAGVREVAGCNIFQRIEQSWKKLARLRPSDPVNLTLQKWQLPELLGVVVTIGNSPEEELTGLFGSPKVGSGDGSDFTAVPVIPEVC